MPEVAQVFAERREGFAPFLRAFWLRGLRPMTPPTPGSILRARAAERPDAVVFIHLTDDVAPPQEITYGELYQRASVIAARLVALELQQRPVLLVYKPGPAFAEAFFGTLLAGAFAVPVPVPQFAAQYERLERVAIDCEPGAILTTSALAASLATRYEASAHVTACPWLATDALDETAAIDLPEVSRDSIALLQYTSGSTAEPRGVVVTHDNLAHNCTTIMRGPAGTRRRQQRVVAAALPRHGADRRDRHADLSRLSERADVADLVSPAAAALARSDHAVSRPTRAARRTSPTPCASARPPPPTCRDSISARGKPPYVGAEPVRPATLAAFAKCFAPYGLRPEALTPCYGMAEATLLVTSKRIGATPNIYGLSRRALEGGQATSSTEASACQLTGCGYAVTATDLRIVDPYSRVEVPRGQVGEVWVAGPQIARGYWRSQGDDAFNAFLAGTRCRSVSAHRRSRFPER